MCLEDIEFTVLSCRSPAEASRCVQPVQYQLRRVQHPGKDRPPPYLPAHVDVVELNAFVGAVLYMLRHHVIRLYTRHFHLLLGRPACTRQTRHLTPSNSARRYRPFCKAQQGAGSWLSCQRRCGEGESSPQLECWPKIGPFEILLYFGSISTRPLVDIDAEE